MADAKMVQKLTIGLQLLAAAQQDNLQTADQLAERVGGRHPPLRGVCGQLRSQGAIGADVSILSDAAAAVRFPPWSTSAGTPRSAARAIACAAA
jgi:hypothetical protein